MIYQWLYILGRNSDFCLNVTFWYLFQISYINFCILLRRMMIGGYPAETPPTENTRPRGGRQQEAPLGIQVIFTHSLA